MSLENPPISKNANPATPGQMLAEMQDYRQQMFPTGTQPDYLAFDLLNQANPANPASPLNPNNIFRSNPESVLWNIIRGKREEEQPPQAVAQPTQPQEKLLTADTIRRDIETVNRVACDEIYRQQRIYFEQLRADKIQK